eukprot:scaffold3368_cov57-Phaeocystis_antarctica.AAC.2
MAVGCGGMQQGSGPGPTVKARPSGPIGRSRGAVRREGSTRPCQRPDGRQPRQGAAVMVRAAR